MSDTNSIAILIPSLGRAHKLEHVYQNAHDNSPGVNIYFCFEPGDQASITTAKNLGYPHFLNERTPSVNGALNTAYLKTTEDYIFTGSDDVNFHPDWLFIVMRVFRDNPGKYKVVGTNDLGNPYVLRAEHATHVMLERSYVEDPGAVYGERRTLAHEGYVHNYGDWELVKLAQKRGVFAPKLDAIVEHLHWCWGKSPKDATYEKQDGANWSHDENLWNQRYAQWKDLPGIC